MSETDSNIDQHQDQPSGEFLFYFTKERLRIHAFIYSLVLNATDAEDIFQRTSITLWQKFAEFDQDRSFYKWSCGIALRDVQNFRRSAIHRKVVFSDELIHKLATEQEDLAVQNHYQLELLEECIAHLKEKDLQIVTQVYRENQPVKDIAENLGKAKQTIYNRLNVIRSGLLDCMERKIAARNHRTGTSARHA